MQDLAGRLANRVQLTTDGHGVYLQAVEDAFGDEIDYAHAGQALRRGAAAARRATARRVHRRPSSRGHRQPRPAHISTSYVERQNLTMRMEMRRFTRLTNAFSKKVENLRGCGRLHFMHYNFCRIHQTLRVTPAKAADVTQTLDD